MKWLQPGPLPKFGPDVHVTIASVHTVADKTDVAPPSFQ